MCAVCGAQGSAADLIKLAMCRWDEWVAAQQQQGEQASTAGGYRARLIAQIHGEHSIFTMVSLFFLGLGRRAALVLPGAMPAPWCDGCMPAASIPVLPADELLFEVDAHDAVLGGEGQLEGPGQQFLQVTAAVKQIMESAAHLNVPLRVKLAWGQSWGSLTALEL